MVKIQKILLVINGDRDPSFWDRTNNEKDGPILSFLKNENDFSTIILFHTPNSQDRPNSKANAEKTCTQILIRYPSIRVVVCEMEGVEEPTHYESILKALRAGYHKHKLDPGQSAEYDILISPGTPQMHACWLLLASSGEIPANVFHIREQRFVTPNHKLVTKINPRIREFPVIPTYLTMEELPEISKEEIETARIQVGMVGKHPAFLDAIELAVRASQTDSPVLLIGETGTGKELFAKFIHNISTRRHRNIISVNSSGLPETLIESELFGYIKGAFTGANRAKSGYFDAANGSTLFLDEIGDMSLATQTKLLRAIQDQQITPVGGTTPHPVDVRIITATHKNLQAEMGQGRFRQDFYYRISTIQISLPSLNQRKSDIPDIARCLLKQFNEKYDKYKELSEAALTELENYHWKGNIRELYNVIESSATLSKGNLIKPEDLRFATSSNEKVLDSHSLIPDLDNGINLKKHLDDIQKEIILKAYEKTGRNMSQTARLTGYTQPNIQKHLKKWNII